MAALAASTPAAMEAVSEARQRRRRSTRRARTTEEGLDQTNEQTPSFELGDESVIPTLEQSGRRGTARERRSRAKKASSERGGMESSSHQQTFEDSTAGVAELLHKIESSHDITSTRPHPPRDDPTDTVQPTQHGRPLPDPSPDTPAPSSDEILSLTLHRSDRLLASTAITHPLLRVSVVDTRTGRFAKKSAPGKSVTSYYERDNPSVDYILPVLTQPSQQGSCLRPSWEETIVFNEEMHHFHDDRLLFFELLDFTTTATAPIAMGTANDHIRERRSAAPWFKIAWAFLRPSQHLIGQKCRLQLYKYAKKRGHPSDGIEVYELWSGGCMKRYPSTLYVSLAAIPPLAAPPEQPRQTTTRSLDPTQEECASVTYEQFLLKQQGTQSGSTLLAETTPLATPLSRLPGQRCRLPTLTHSLLHPSRDGCSVAKFSHAGRLLAVGGANSSHAYPIIIYEVSLFSPVLSLEGHRGIIYDIIWSADDLTLASASADGLVKVWSVSQPQPLHTLPHPCYVYCLCHAPSYPTSSLLTGAYDGRIRHWTTDSGSVQLLKELVLCGEGGATSHGLVNSLVWREESQTLFAAHSSGVVVVWQHSRGGGGGAADTSEGGVAGTWRVERKINVITEGALCSIALHPTTRSKLLAQSDRGRVVMMDLRIDRVCCEFRGVFVSGAHKSCGLVSPCGELVLASGEDAKLFAWNSSNGKLLHTFSDLPFSAAISSVAFHPTNHVLVVTCFAPHQPLVVLMAASPAACEGGEGGSGDAVRLKGLGHRLENAKRTLDSVTEALK